MSISFLEVLGVEFVKSMYHSLVLSGEGTWSAAENRCTFVKKDERLNCAVVGSVDVAGNRLE